MRVSASSVSTWRDCQRKWAWRYIAGIKTEPNASAALGSECHDQLQTYLEGGDLDFTKESGEIAASGTQHLPRPLTPGMKCEEEYAFEGPSGHVYFGFKDVEITPQVPGDVPVVIDHKTTSDLKWQKRESDLLKDPQAVLYAVDAFAKNPTAQQVELKWVYYQTRGTRKSSVTHLRVVPEQIHPEFQAIESQVDEMADVLATVKDPKELPPTTEHCSAYGGCPYQGYCNLSPFEKLRSTMSQGTNSLLAKLKANRIGPQAINPPEYSPPNLAPPPGEAPLVVAEPTPDAVAFAAAFEKKEAEKKPRAKRAPAAPLPGVDEAHLAAQKSAKNEAEERERPNPPPAASPAAPPQHATPPEALAVRKIVTLFVDCGPVTEPCVDAFTFILAGKERLRAEGIVDYRFVDFGHGAAKLAAAVGAEIDAQLGTVGFVRISTDSPESHVVMSEFVQRANMVVR